MLINEIYKEIYLITQKLNGESLLKASNFPVVRWNQIQWDTFRWISQEFKKDMYNDIYIQVQKDWNFNFQFLDGAMIQMLYNFDSKWNILLSHRLVYYPDIGSIQFWEDPDEFEERLYWMQIFWDQIYVDNVSTPLRFDYKRDDDAFNEYLHSYSHLSIGSYKNCRITLSSPLTPSQYIHFIIKAFYSEKFIEIPDLHSILETTNLFDSCITENESKKTHILIR